MKKILSTKIISVLLTMIIIFAQTGVMVFAEEVGHKVSDDMSMTKEMTKGTDPSDEMTKGTDSSDEMDSLDEMDSFDAKVVMLSSKSNSNTFDISTGNITIKKDSEENLKITYGSTQDKIISKEQMIIITGTTTTNKVVVESDVTANITLNNVNIKSLSAFELQGNAKVSLTLVGENILESTAENAAGLQVAKDGMEQATLEITEGSNGSLSVQGGKNGAGIGGRANGNGGTITINGGEVVSNGGNNGAGIGGGFEKAGGNITINGGKVNATGGQQGAGIGGGFFGAGGDITINGGEVVSNGGNNGAGIGGGYNGAGGTLSTGANGNAWVTVNNPDTDITGFTSGVLSMGDTITVYGNPTIDSNFEVGSTQTLIIKNEQILTIKEGVVLTNNGTIIIKKGGQLVNSGTIITNGTINGNVTGRGDVITDNEKPTLTSRETIYRFTDGSKIIWKKGEISGLTITSNGSFKKFKNIRIDGTVVKESNYTAKSGSTIVTLIPEYLESLSVGEHTLRLAFSDGYAQTSFTIAEADNTNISLENPFTDVSKNDWFHDYVMFIYNQKIIAGTSTTTFSPNDKVTRGMMATLLWKMGGSPMVTGISPYADVEIGKYYTDAVIWTTEKSIFSGYEDKTFRAEESITREQLAAIFYNYAKYKGYDLSLKDDLSKFIDKEEVSPWAKETVSWAVGSGLINGKGNQSLDPRGTATRAEVTVMLQRFIENIN